MRGGKMLLAASAMVNVMTFAGAAWAQDSTASANVGPQDASVNADIVVTAQRRSELARDVPLSLTALSGDALRSAGVTDTYSLQNLTPGLKMDRVGNFTLPAIRGITTTITGPAADANVAIYLDGVYQPATVANTFDLPDVERVEVLKGPQGTLFGRNATGGAIQVFTKEPSYELTGAGTVSYGNYDDFIAKGFISAPLVADKLAVSLSGFYHSNDSYYHDIRPDGPGLSGAKAWLVRGKLRMDLTERLKVILSGSYSDRRESVAIYGSPLNGNTVAKLLDPNAIIPTRPLDVALNDDSRPQHVKAYELSGKIQWEGDGGTLTSITAYNKFKLRNVLDADYAYTPNGVGVNYHVNSYDRYFSQELNYASDLDGPFNFVLGFYYTDGEGAWYPLGVQTPSYGVSIYGRQEVKSYAGFGELYYNITDKLSVIGGLRYSWEKRSQSGDQFLGSVSAPVPAHLTFIDSRKWDSFTPRASIRYAVTPRSNVYFTYSQGFKSGVYNTSNVAQADLANPEKVKAFEVGYKGRLSSALTIDAAAFYYKYDDLQANIFTSVDGVPLSFVRNAANARIYGAEVDAQYVFSPAFDLRAALSYLDPKYQDFTNASVNVPNALNAGNDTIAYDASGQQMIRAPSFTASVTANGHADVAGGKLDLMASLYYTTKVYFTFDHRIQQPGYATVDARAAWTPANSGLTVSVYGKNLTDKVTLGGTFVTEVADGVSYTQPRTYGVQLDYRF